MDGSTLKTYAGSCHCGTVKVEVELDLSQPSCRCNCSICRRMHGINIGRLEGVSD